MLPSFPLTRNHLQVPTSTIQQCVRNDSRFRFAILSAYLRRLVDLYDFISPIKVKINAAMGRASFSPSSGFYLTEETVGEIRFDFALGNLVHCHRILFEVVLTIEAELSNLWFISFHCVLNASMLIYSVDKIPTGNLAYCLHLIVNCCWCGEDWKWKHLPRVRRREIVRRHQ